MTHGFNDQLVGSVSFLNYYSLSRKKPWNTPHTENQVADRPALDLILVSHQQMYRIATEI